MFDTMDIEPFLNELDKLNKRLSAALRECKVVVTVYGKEADFTVTCPSEYYQQIILAAMPNGENLSEEDAPIEHALINAYGINHWVLSVDKIDPRRKAHA